MQNFMSQYIKAKNNNNNKALKNHNNLLRTGMEPESPEELKVFFLNKDEKNLKYLSMALSTWYYKYIPLDCYNKVFHN